MRRFTEAYDAARDALKSYEFSKNWKGKLDLVIGVKDIFADPSGPQPRAGIKLNTLRTTIESETRRGKSEGKTILSMCGVSGIRLTGMKSEDAQAAAAIKMLRHLYLERQAGAQSIWIYSQPYSFHKWVFDDLKGKNGWSAESKLSKTDEVYDERQRRCMAAGAAQARAWCLKCVAKLGTPNQKTKAMVKTWFCNAAELDEVDGACRTLKDGFMKIAALLGSNKLIFSDEPIDRMRGDKVKGKKHSRGNWEDYAFVGAANAEGERERLDAVYIQNATLKAWGDGGDSWMATLAIVHELSHRVLNTKDVVYDFKGLKPNDVLSFKHAIKNADSWAYFAADLNGELTDSKREKYYKGPKALLQRYLDSLSG